MLRRRPAARKRNRGPSTTDVHFTPHGHEELAASLGDPLVRLLDAGARPGSVKPTRRSSQRARGGYAPLMSDARAGSLHAVRSSLRTLVYCCAASALIDLGTRLAFDFCLRRLRSDEWHDYSVLEVTSALSYMTSIAVLVASAMAIARL